MNLQPIKYATVLPPTPNDRRITSKREWKKRRNESNNETSCASQKKNKVSEQLFFQLQAKFFFSKHLVISLFLHRLPSNRNHTYAGNLHYGNSKCIQNGGINAKPHGKRVSSASLYQSRGVWRDSSQLIVVLVVVWAFSIDLPMVLMGYVCLLRFALPDFTPPRCRFFIAAERWRNRSAVRIDRRRA